ncbi:hypothetical protein G3580_13125 [Nitrogeniibacter mangrovi]|uniref:Uncharacterized protein n=1 Tax=Nitrogeniibacter mangrovi TaxID=2016596 RepID=A0A6C1B615_9RHOO|nr:hypothetical protein [Nitrogeniibacter mangrovi]QID18489.1 hypothetical protein G3580_13125 [Nitrogeniibacter mangrovi]
MRRETAYKLAGRHHDARVAATGLVKQREIRFRPLPPGQTDKALTALQRLKGLKVRPSTLRDLTLEVEYSVIDYSLELLENALRDAGFHLDNSLYVKLVRALVYFTEETQRHNIASPERLIKQSNEVYINVYDQHPHGDHDDTPIELRDYK